MLPVISILFGMLLQIMPLRGILQIMLIAPLGYAIGRSPLIDSGKKVFISYISIVIGVMITDGIMFVIFKSINTGLASYISEGQFDPAMIALYFAFTLLKYILFYMSVCYMGHLSSYEPDLDKKQNKDIEEYSRR